MDSSAAAVNRPKSLASSGYALDGELFTPLIRRVPLLLSAGMTLKVLRP